ncbi:MAG: biotin/lipoyl-binding protein [Acidobacteria bacterium]|nr:biotin/lipoyl-binding protein [Acidobacteriota bacterium]
MPPPVEVAVAAAETRQMERALALTGSLLPDETVNLSAEVAGTLAQLFVDFGQPVRKGLIVAELDKRELNLQAERARAALSQAMARIGLSAGQEDANPDSTPALRQAIAQLEDARFKFESAERLVQSGDISRERCRRLAMSCARSSPGYRACAPTGNWRRSMSPTPPCGPPSTARSPPGWPRPANSSRSTRRC